MPSKSPASEPARPASAAPQSVETFLASLDHPFKREILALREIILGADPAIGEEIKWNAPSFRTTEHFATMQLRAKDGVQVIMHLGAKKRDDADPRAAIADPESLLEWLAPDRASAKFRDIEDVRAKESVFAELIRQWIRHL